MNLPLLDESTTMERASRINDTLDKINGTTLYRVGEDGIATQRDGEDQELQQEGREVQQLPTTEFLALLSSVMAFCFYTCLYNFIMFCVISHYHFGDEAVKEPNSSSLLTFILLRPAKGLTAQAGE